MNKRSAREVLAEVQAVGLDLIRAGAPIPTAAETRRYVEEIDHRLLVLTSPGYQPAPGEAAPAVAIEVLRDLRQVAVLYLERVTAQSN